MGTRVSDPDGADPGSADATSDQSGVAVLDEDYVILSTIHSAKVQEWKSVLLLNAVDGCIPSDLGASTTSGSGDAGTLTPAHLCLSTDKSGPNDPL